MILICHQNTCYILCYWFTREFAPADPYQVRDRLGSTRKPLKMPLLWHVTYDTTYIASQNGRANRLMLTLNTMNAFLIFSQWQFFTELRLGGEDTSVRNTDWTNHLLTYKETDLTLGLCDLNVMWTRCQINSLIFLRFALLSSFYPAVV